MEHTHRGAGGRVPKLHRAVISAAGQQSTPALTPVLPEVDSRSTVSPAGPPPQYGFDWLLTSPKPSPTSTRLRLVDEVSVVGLDHAGHSSRRCCR